MVGEELKKWRESYSFTQGQLAEALGVDVMTISRWEREERAIPSFLELALDGIKCKFVEDEIKACLKNGGNCLFRKQGRPIRNAIIESYKNGVVSLVCLGEVIREHVQYFDRREDVDGHGTVFVLTRDPLLRAKATKRETAK